MVTTRDVNWDDLRYFIAAARSNSLSGASRVMGVEHTTIGRRLSALERSLGAPLVVRSPEGLLLTPLGTRITPLVEDLERAIGAITEIAVLQRARVRVATPSGFARLVSRDLAKLRQDHPEIALEILSGARTVELKSGEVQLAIRVGAIADQQLIARKVCDAGFSLYASEGYLARKGAPLDPENLAGHEIVGFDHVLASTPAGRWIASHSAGADVVLHAPQMTDVLSAVSSDAGIGLLPCFLELDQPGLRRLTPKVLAAAPMSIVYSREVRIAEPVRAVFQHLTAVLRRQAPLIGGHVAEVA